MTPKQRSDRARKAAQARWAKNKTNAQPEYERINAPRKPAGNELIEIAAPLPSSINALAGGIAKWEDPILELSRTAYTEMRRNYAIIKAHRRLAIRTQKLNWTIVGMGARAEAAMEIFGQIRSWSDFVDHCTGSIYEGTRPYQIKRAPPREGSSDAWTVPDFWMGARHRYNAGGDIEWDGAEKLVQVERGSGTTHRKALILPRDQFALHCPGPANNPEGFLDIGVALYNAVARPTNRGITSGDLWVRLFAIPALMLGAKLDQMQPTSVSAALLAKINAAADAVNSPNDGIRGVGLSDQDTVQLLQADPGGLTGMVAWMQHLESIADDILSLGALMASSGVAQAGRTGDTGKHRDNEDEAAFANGVAIAETFNRDIKPWIDSRNEMPALADGEADWYLWPADPTEDDEQDVEVETEGADDAPDAREFETEVLSGVTMGSVTRASAKMLLTKHTTHDPAYIDQLIASAHDDSSQG